MASHMPTLLTLTVREERIKGSFTRLTPLAHHWSSLDHCLAGLLKLPPFHYPPSSPSPSFSLQADTYLQLEGEVGILPPDLQDFLRELLQLL